MLRIFSHSGFPQGKFSPCVYCAWRGRVTFTLWYGLVTTQCPRLHCKHTQHLDLRFLKATKVAFLLFVFPWNVIRFTWTNHPRAPSRPPSTYKLVVLNVGVFSWFSLVHVRSEVWQIKHSQVSNLDQFNMRIPVIFWNIFMNTPNP